jgi:hypothetical protein
METLPLGKYAVTVDVNEAEWVLVVGGLDEQDRNAYSGDAEKVQRAAKDLRASGNRQVRGRYREPFANSNCLPIRHEAGQDRAAEFPRIRALRSSQDEDTERHDNLKRRKRA